MRWSTADSSVGATTTHSASPASVPTSAAIAPTRAPCATSDEPDVLVGGPDGREHAELAEPALGDDREARSGDQRGQQHEDRRYGEHRQRILRPLVRPGLGPRERGLASLAQRLHERPDRPLAGRDENRDVIRSAR